MRRDTNSSSEALARWLFALTLVGYPVAGLIASLMDWGSTLTSIPFRVGVVVLALALWWRSPALTRWSRHHRWLMVFLLLYLARLIWDWAIADVHGAAEASIFFLLTVLLPCAALALAAPAMREIPAALLLVAIGGTVCAGAVLMQLLGLGVDQSLTEQTGRLSFEAVNPITLGHVATITLIASLCLTRHRPGALEMSWVIVAALAAGACLLLSASRGPALAFALCMLVFVLVTGRWRWIMLITLLLVSAVLIEGGELWLRFAGIAEDESTSERLLLQGNAISQFLAHPLFGSAFVDPELLTYPHNLFIETAMALGVVGLGILMLVLARACLRAIKQMRHGNILVPLLFVQYLFAAQLSGAIYGNAGLWMITALLVSLASYVSPTPAHAQTRPPPPGNSARPTGSVQSS
jgi:hypothetical protein